MSDIENLKEANRDRKAEIKELAIKLEDMTKAYAIGFENFHEEFRSVSQGIEDIKKILYNNEKTEEKGLVQQFNVLRAEFFYLKTIVEKLIGKRNTKRNNRIKLWSAIVLGTTTTWALVKEYGHDFWIWITTLNTHK